MLVNGAPSFKVSSLRPSESPLEATGEKREKMHKNGEAYAKGVTGRMPWRDLLLRSHLPPPVIAECEAQLGGAHGGDRREPKAGTA